MIEKQLFKDAKKVVSKHNNYSTSFLQRTLQIGYNRASDIMKVIKKPKQDRRLFSKKSKKIRIFYR